MTSVRPTRKMIGALAVSLICGALIAVSTHISLLRTARTETARLSRVTATVIEPAEPDRGRPAIARWTATDGTSRAGAVPTQPGHTAGTSHPVWIDESGRITTPPRSPVQRGAQTALSGICVAAAIMIIFAHRGRPDPIDVEWENIASQWRQRHL